MTEFLSVCADFFGKMLTLCVAALFLENTIFSRALGTSTMLFSVRKHFHVFRFGLVMTIVITLSAVLTWAVYPLIRSTGYAYELMPAVCVLIMGIFYVLSLVATRSMPEEKREEYRSILHVSVFNCAVLGALLLMVGELEYSLAGYIGFGIGTGLGFMVASYLVQLAYEHLSSDEVPAVFRGLPITLIYLGIASLAIYGLIGHVLPY